MTAGAVDRHPTRTLGILTIGAFAYALAQTMVVPALADIQHQYHASESAATWLLTGFLLSACVATPIVGRLGDMYGKERLLLVSLAIFGTGSVVSALGGSLGVIVAGRVVQGAGGAIFPLTFGIIRDEFPRERVGRSIGIVSTTLGIGGGAGLILPGVLIKYASVDWIFWSSAIIVAFSAFTTWRYVPESPVRVRARVDYIGGVLLSLFLTALLLAVSEGNDWGWTSGRILGLFAASVVLGIGWAAWEHRTPEPLVDFKMLGSRPVLTTNIATVFVGFAMFGSYILVPQFVQTPRGAGYGFGASIIASGVFLLPSALVMLVAGPISGSLGSRFGSRLPLLLGSVAAGLGYLMLGVLHSQEWEIYVGGGLMGIGIGLAFAAMANLVVEAVRPEETGVASGINTIMRNVGGAVGAQIAAALLEGGSVSVHGVHYPAESGYTAAFVMSAIGALVALLATLAVPRRRSDPDLPTVDSVGDRVLEAA